jgi:hypothetical protein
MREKLPVCPKILTTFYQCATIKILYFDIINLDILTFVMSFQFGRRRGGGGFVQFKTVILFLCNGGRPKSLNKPFSLPNSGFF